MLRAIYTAGTAMIAQNRRMDVVANNLSNVETAGFKMDTLATRSFNDMLISRINDPNVYSYKYVGDHNLGIHIDQTYTAFTEGPLIETGVSTDMALSGDGFFVVDRGGAERYTRAGTFSVDVDGYLVTGRGDRVMGVNGQVYVGSTDFDVLPDGTVSVGGTEVNRLRLVAFADNNGLRKQGDNLYSNYDAAANPIRDAGTSVTVNQGMLESSNVDAARETVNMLEIYRHYEINQRVLRMLDDSLGRAVNDIARV